MQECPLCSEHYNPDQVKMLSEQDGNHLVHITCDKCLNSILVMVLVSSLGMSSVGIITDLDAADASRLRLYPPISEDELLNFHKFIQKENQFEKLFKL